MLHIVLKGQVDGSVLDRQRSYLSRADGKYFPASYHCKLNVFVF